jgi:hypothetical protein
MAINFQNSINRTSVVSQSNEDKDIEQEKNDSLLYNKNEVEDNNN